MSNKIQTYMNTSLNNINRFAKIVSNLINPPLMGIFIVCILTVRTLENPLQALKWLSLTITLTTVPPLVYVIYLVKTGYLADIYMPNREKRLKPLSVIFVWLIISIALLILFQAPKAMPVLISAVLVEIILLGIVTILWKISFHSATVMSAATITILLQSDLAWMMPILVPLVAWARVQLQRHTIMQVIAGAFLGWLFTLAAFNFIGFYLKLW